MFVLYLGENNLTTLHKKLFTLKKDQCSSLDDILLPVYFAAIHAKAGSICKVDVSGVHSNIIMVDITHPALTAANLCERLAQVLFFVFLIFIICDATQNEAFITI